MSLLLPARPWLRYLLVSAVFLSLAFIETAQIRFMDMDRHNEVAYLVLLRMPVAYYGFWALATPVIIWVVRRSPLTAARWPSTLAGHAVTWFVLSSIQAVVRAPMHHFIYPWMGDAAPMRSLIMYYFVGNITNNLLVYSVVALVTYSVAYIRGLQERELRASQLQARLGEAKLNALKMQIQPHFLFNTFNNISALMRKDVEAAENMISDLSDLLRRTLETSSAHEIPLREELALLDPYLSIQRMRFQDRLTVHMDVGDETLSALLPNLTLHTLVENALHHGVAQRSSGGEVWIRSAREQDRLTIAVSDNGPGMSDGIADAFDRGIGLRNTRERLQQLYGADYRFELGQRDGGGVVATVAVPFHLTASHPTEIPEATLS